MPILESQVDRNSDDYKRNREKMLLAIAEFRAAEASVQATSEKSRARFAKRKQLMPRERIALLLDRGAPFLELMPLAGYRMHDDKDGSSAGGGSVAGIGYVEGVRCVVSASNSAIKGGTVAPSGQRKGQRRHRTRAAELGGDRLQRDDRDVGRAERHRVDGERGERDRPGGAAVDIGRAGQGSAAAVYRFCCVHPPAFLPGSHPASIAERAAQGCIRAHCAIHDWKNRL